MTGSRVHLNELLKRSSATHPDRTAIFVEGKSITYRELDLAVEAFCAELRKLNLPGGSRIALLLENSIEYAIAFFAVLRANLVVVPLDTSASASTLSYVLSDCDVKVLIAHSRYRRQLKDATADALSLQLLLCDASLKIGHPTMKVVTFGEFVKIDKKDDLTELRVEAYTEPITLQRNGKQHELAAIFYTSGSTGTPKGVMLSHLNLVSNTEATVEYLKLTEADRTLVILPFYYIYGNSLLLTNVASGACLVVDNMFMYPETVLNTMQEQKCTGLSGVPSNFMILLGKSTLTQRSYPDLRYFTQAGGAMAPDVTRKLMDAFPDKEIYIMYGQTEAAPRVTYLPPNRLEEKLGSIGIPLTGISVDICDEQGNSIPSGTAGELVVSGDNVMMGYWNQAEEEREVLKQGRLHTGDLGYKDSDGFIFIVGRKKEIIKSGGNRVSVKEVEECLVAFDGVLEACVIGVPDPLLGEAIKAVIVPKPGAELEQGAVLLHCKRKLADFKVPKIITIAESLPKYQSGKINRQLLKQQSVAQ